MQVNKLLPAVKHTKCVLILASCGGCNVDRIRLLLFFAIFIQAIPSLGWESLIVGDKEWYKTADTAGYCYQDYVAICPEGICTGSIGGNDLTGWTWATVDDVNDLFNRYIGSNELNGPSEYRDYDSGWGWEILQDFGTNGDGWFYTVPAVVGWTSTGFYVGSASATGYTATSPSSNSGADTSKTFPTPQCELTFLGAWLYRSAGASNGAVTVLLEEPVNDETHSGIGNLRGWAISGEGIDRVEIYINGKYMYDAPYGGERIDVGDQYPYIAGSHNSGFSLAFGYSNLGVGEHAIMARAFNNLGEFMDSTATFEVVAFHKDFINKWDIVDTSQATMTATGDEILLDNVSVDEQVYELRLKWRTAEQGFEIIEIR